jgi:AraC-like DNA-binding protein
MNLFIKNMVCNRCIMAVRQALEETGVKPVEVTLDEVRLAEALPEAALQELNTRLVDLGFELLDSQKQKQIEKIKTLLIQKVQHGAIEEHFSISRYLTENLHKDYAQMSRLFSEVEAVTIEQYFILQKIEKVKEWLVYGEANLSEMAWKLGYSSVAHLSAQFKKTTGLTPSQFKALGRPHRKPLDNV